MKFSEKWLRTWVNPPMDTQGLADCLTFGGIEIEGVTPVAPAFERVVVGEVLSVEKHPNADRLNVCQVNIGVAPLTIVCGAPNARAGMRVPVALVGALPDKPRKSPSANGPGLVVYVALYIARQLAGQGPVPLSKLGKSTSATTAVKAPASRYSQPVVSAAALSRPTA